MNVSLQCTYSMIHSNLTVFFGFFAGGVGCEGFLKKTIVFSKRNVVSIERQVISLP